jgi:hypothetical protein
MSSCTREPPSSPIPHSLPLAFFVVAAPPDSLRGVTGSPHDTLPSDAAQLAGIARRLPVPGADPAGLGAYRPHAGRWSAVQPYSGCRSCRPPRGAETARPAAPTSGGPGPRRLCVGLQPRVADARAAGRGCTRGGSLLGRHVRDGRGRRVAGRAHRPPVGTYDGVHRRKTSSPSRFATSVGPRTRTTVVRRRGMCWPWDTLDLVSHEEWSVYVLAGLRPGRCARRATWSQRSGMTARTP